MQDMRNSLIAYYGFVRQLIWDFRQTRRHGSPRRQVCRPGGVDVTAMLDHDSTIMLNLLYFLLQSQSEQAEHQYNV